MNWKEIFKKKEETNNTEPVITQEPKSNSNEKEELRKLKEKIDSCRNPRLVMDAIDWLSIADRAVVITTNDEGTWTYDKSDKKFDPDFLNRCKDIIRDDIYEKLGQEGYADKLDEYEPDLAHAFREMEYYAAKAAYFEAFSNYHIAINDVNHGNSYDFSMMWADVQEKERIMIQAQQQMI